MNKCEIQGLECKQTPKGWECEDELLKALLEQREQILRLEYSPSFGDPRLYVFLEIVKDFQGKVLSQDKPEYDPKLIY